MQNRSDGLPGLIWHEFEALRFEKTLLLQQRFRNFETYFDWQQSHDSSGLTVVDSDLIILFPETKSNVKK